jgi:uroporphyrinogen decarboxylase
MNLPERSPDFANLRRVLRREAPARPTLFEFFLNERLYETLAGAPKPADWNTPAFWRWVARAYARAGYDYVTVQASNWSLPKPDKHRAATISLNDAPTIVDRRTFDAYAWTEPEDFKSMLDGIADGLPRGMKLVVWGPGGVLENVIGLTGYDNLCLMLADDPELVADLFEAVGSRFVRYYRAAAPHPAVGACISNDDWGFKTQTMLAPADMRRYVFPWHTRIVEAIHAAGRPAILHSCGNLGDVFDDIIDVMKYDAKHSYEDLIVPVEDAYERWGRRIAILGGIDVDFLCRSTPDAIRARSRAMLDRSATRGGYALGSGNSIPGYVPDEGYFAMIAAALEV